MSSNAEGAKAGHEKEKSPAGGATSPMEVGMGMMKKMMAQMGQGEGPMAMMQKMMARMKDQQGKETGNPIQEMTGMCMGMCAEMLTGLHKTAALATFISPELRNAFEEWLGSREGEVLKLLQERGEMDLNALAIALKLSDEIATYLITHLKNKGAISLRVRALPSG